MLLSNAHILADSQAPCGSRLTTFLLTYPRFIHGELLTHRMLSRNAASSRAVSMRKMRALVLRAPAKPAWWGKHQRGMSAREELPRLRRALAEALWYGARYPACAAHWLLERVGLHKQLTNRIIEPWQTMQTIVTGTDKAWQHFLHLRNHTDAQPEAQRLARLVAHQLEFKAPFVRKLRTYEYHIPYLREQELSQPDAIRIAVGRIARVSFLTHDGRRDSNEDIKLHDKLINTPPGEPQHLSPTEHVAMCAPDGVRVPGNFGAPWLQYRAVVER